jgi:hypothetical protein
MSPCLSVFPHVNNSKNSFNKLSWSLTRVDFIKIYAHISSLVKIGGKASWICAILGCYASFSGGSVPTFRDNLSVPSLRVKMGPTGYAETCTITQRSAKLTYIGAKA